ncbi:MAG: DUF4114 domain-containing protein [Candidatus Hydrogenedentes bacterium]|nr:DUF4114 domain-containing protein [Candidatus Hydrogenedentota bacterium]
MRCTGFTSAFRGARPLLVAACCILSAGCGPEDAPVQSPRRPLGLDPVDTVKQAGSDRAARRFQRDGLTEAVRLASQSFTHDVIAERFAEFALDPARLDVAEKTRVRVYFIGEASGYANALGVNMEGVGPEDGARIIFPMPYTPVNLYEMPKLILPETNRLDDSKLGERSESEAVLPGDFVDLGTVSAGTVLSFFLIADDRRGNVNVYTPVPERNPDGLQHMVAIAMEGSPYLILSFEDMFQGGDRDYSDCVFAVEMSAYNIQALLGRIDPWRQAKRLAFMGTIIGLIVGAPLGYAAWRRRAQILRFRRARREALGFLEHAEPAKAVEAVRRAKAGCRPADRAALAEIEVDALGRFKDYAGLTGAYTEAREAFAKHEDASLSLGHAFVETDRPDDYADLRAVWRERSAGPAAWHILDADLLLRRGKPDDALALLNRRRFAGPDEARRLARLAVIAAGRAPDQAGAPIAEAVRLAPDNPDVRLAEGAVEELRGDAARAAPAYRAALELAPGDPFVRDQAAEFLRRQGRLREAVGTWAKGLPPPTMDFVWTKALFWARAAAPIAVDWAKFEPPDTEARPLIDFLRGLGPGRFWDAAAFEPIALAHPHLATRQESFWLRLLDALGRRREDEALSLLNLSRFGDRSWHEALELALIRVLTFRRLGFMDPSLTGSAPDPRRQAAPHPFFGLLGRWTKGQLDPVPDDLVRLLQTDNAFAATLLAAGWDEAGLLLWRTPIEPGQAPPWLAAAAARALKHNRGTDQARAFAHEHGIPLDPA